MRLESRVKRLEQQTHPDELPLSVFIVSIKDEEDCGPFEMSATFVWPTGELMRILSFEGEPEADFRKRVRALKQVGQEDAARLQSLSLQELPEQLITNEPLLSGNTIRIGG